MIKLRFLIPTLIIALFLNSVSAQNTIEWQKNFGGNNGDWAGSILPTPDGGYIVSSKSLSDKSGIKSEPSQGDYDSWILKLNSSGEIEWQKTLGGKEYDALNFGYVLPNGGFLLAGTSCSDISGNKTVKSKGKCDLWIVKLTSKGEIESQKVFGGEKYDGVLNNFKAEVGRVQLSPTSDGGYILGSSSNSDPSVDKKGANIGWNDYWVLKLNSQLEIEWENTYGSKSIETLTVTKQAKDGGYIIGGMSNGGGSGDKTEKNRGPIGEVDGWIIKIDKKGKLLWERSLGSVYSDNLTDAVPTEDGGVLVALSSWYGSGGDKTVKSALQDVWLVKLSNTGTIEWQKSIGGASVDYPEILIPTPDGNYMLGCVSFSGISGDKTEKGRGNSDIWLVKVDKTGKILWQKTIGGNKEDLIGGMAFTSDGGLILTTTSNSGIKGDKTIDIERLYDVWTIKLK